MKYILNVTNRLFDWLQRYWESAGTQRILGTGLASAFILAIGIIHLNWLGFLPEPYKSLLPTNHLAAIALAFTLLLVLEVVSLVLSLARSVSDSVGKQFEILSVILLRDTFQEFANFNEPLVWEDIGHSIVPITATALAALLIFVVLGFYYPAQRHTRIVKDEEDKASFIAAKKVIALLLLASFIFVVLNNLWLFITDREPTAAFESFYTLLIFSDILVVLISLRYSASYHVAFRNSGFAVATVFIRLALIAPLLTGALLGVGTAVFALGITFAYNIYTQNL
ncbi:MAG: hypothetical protein OEZ02_13345 [Anaerolineae bacterium]|nr:hypothetical protein [Anaerolineae bacterium]